MRQHTHSRQGATPLPQHFFARDALAVAPDLLGKYLVRRHHDRTIERYMITEVEAYRGEEDRACHACKGKTPRNAIMYGPAGVWYIYLIYGMYDMLNIVTNDDAFPAAVLIRGIEGYDGPGKLTRALGITRSLNATTASEHNDLWIEDHRVTPHVSEVSHLPRIGVAYAGEWADRPWRWRYESAGSASEIVSLDT